MRFKQLTLFMAAMAAAVGGIGQYAQYRWWIALGALFITAVMWVMEVRSTLNFWAVHKVGPHLWIPAHSKLFPWLTATLVVLILHVAFYAFWLGVLRTWGPSACITFCLGLVVGLALLVFSIVNYSHVSR